MSRLGWVLILAGAAARVAFLPLPGTPDVPDWKATSFVASSDFLNIYGRGGSPPEERRLQWDRIDVTTEYPPISHAELAVVGWTYRRTAPDFHDSTLLTALIKTPGLLAELAFLLAMVTWGGRMIGRASAAWAIALFWLSPAIWLAGSVLGYLDAQMAVPATLAVLAASTGRPAVAGALIGVAIFTKPQAVFVLPVISAVIMQGPTWASRRRALGAAAAAGAVVAAIALLPFVAAGTWPSMLRAFQRLGEHDLVSGTAANLWWIISWAAGGAARLGELGIWGVVTRPATMVRISTVVAGGAPNPRLIGTVLTVAALAWAMWRTTRARDLATQCFLAAWCVMAYFVLSGQVHENHSYLALPLLAVAAGIDRSLRMFYALITAGVALNLYMFYGLGTSHPPVFDRGVTIVDASVLLSVANVALFAWWTLTVAARTRAPRIADR